MSSVGTQNAAREGGPAPPFWHAPLEFAAHAVVGTAIFAIIAAAAVFLNIGVAQLQAHFRVTEVIIYGLEAAEYALFGTDLLLYAVFLWRTARRTIKKL